MLRIELNLADGAQDKVKIYLVVPVLADNADDHVDVHLLDYHGQNDKRKQHGLVFQNFRIELRFGKMLAMRRDKSFESCPES